MRNREIYIKKIYKKIYGEIYKKLFKFHRTLLHFYICGIDGNI